MKEKFVILKKTGIHCARGTKTCKKCQAESKNIYYSLYELGEPKQPEIAQPFYSIELNGEKLHVADSNLVQSFLNEEEAKGYSKKHNIGFVDITKPKIKSYSKKELNEIKKEMEETLKEIKDFKESINLVAGEVISKITYPISKIPKPDQKQTYCLLELGPKYSQDGQPMAQPMIQIDGKLIEYSVKKPFKSKEEALKYSKEHSTRFV